MLIFLPDFYRETSEALTGRMERVADPVYQLRAWTAFVHPLLALTAALAVAVAIRRRSVLAITGALGFTTWALVEMAQQALTLFAFDPWRRAWLAGDAAVRQSMEVRVAIYDGLWEAAYNLLLVAFLIGCGAFAAALLRDHDRLGRLVGMFYAGAALLTLVLLIAQFGGPLLTGEATKWVYAATQPLARVVIGVWLWRAARTMAAP